MTRLQFPPMVVDLYFHFESIEYRIRAVTVKKRRLASQVKEKTLGGIISTFPFAGITLIRC